MYTHKENSHLGWPGQIFCKYIIAISTMVWDLTLVSLNPRLLPVAKEMSVTDQRWVFIFKIYF